MAAGAGLGCGFAELATAVAEGTAVAEAVGGISADGGALTSVLVVVLGALADGDVPRESFARSRMAATATTRKPRMAASSHPHPGSTTSMPLSSWDRLPVEIYGKWGQKAKLEL